MGENLMKLAVIFIGTGNYINFLPDWYQSCEKYLIPDLSKTYFIFTDGLIETPPNNVKLHHQNHLQWPFITLNRWEIILKAQSELKEFDFILFLDADMKVVSQIEVSEIITDKNYLGVHHPCHFLQMHPHDKSPGTFETRVNSTAGITESDDTSIYFQGCVWGGKSNRVIEMLKELNSRTQKDLENNIVAVWHDESHINKFFAERLNEVHILSSKFAYPEAFSNQCQFEPVIIHLAKNNSNYHK